MASDPMRLAAALRGVSRVGLLALAAAYFWWVQFGFPHSFGDPDAYYHAAVSRLIAQQGLPDGFPWMYFTTWRDHYADQHFLYHVLLIPFADVGRLPWSIVLFSTAAAAALLWTLASFGFRAAGLWLFVFVFGSADFLYRISIVKANTLAIVLLLAALVALRARRHGFLLPLSALFVWVYGGFVFVPVVVAAHGLVASACERRLVWRPAVLCAGGLALGVALHPQAAHLAYHLYTQMFQAGLGASEALGVGVEWSPYRPVEFWRINGLVAGVYLAACGLFLRCRGAGCDEQGRWRMTLLILSGFFLLLTLRSRRFVEYFVPFAVLFAASVVSPFLERWHGRGGTATGRRRAGAAAAATIAVGVLAWSAVGTTTAVWNSFHDFRAVPPDRYRAAAEWMRDLSREGDIVFNPRWDEFAQLFYWNQKNYYVVGMDPTFLYLYDQNLYRDWYRFYKDDVADLSAEWIHDTLTRQFRASFVFVDRFENPRLLRLLAGSSQFREIFADPFVAVYAVR